jgi:hypothetical protein
MNLKYEDGNGNMRRYSLIHNKIVMLAALAQRTTTLVLFDEKTELI